MNSIQSNRTAEHKPDGTKPEYNGNTNPEILKGSYENSNGSEPPEGRIEDALEQDNDIFSYPGC